MNFEWHEGDRAFVTGDAADWGHHFPRDIEVRLKEPEGETWYCEPVDGEYQWHDWEKNVPTATGQTTQEGWWVHFRDLGDPTPEPTDEEVAALFGIGVESPEEHDRAVAEVAWDEGYQRGLRDSEQDVTHGADNPYRKES